MPDDKIKIEVTPEQLATLLLACDAAADCTLVGQPRDEHGEYARVTAETVRFTEMAMHLADYVP